MKKALLPVVTLIMLVGLTNVQAAAPAQDSVVQGVTEKYCGDVSDMAALVMKYRQMGKPAQNLDQLDQRIGNEGYIAKMADLAYATELMTSERGKQRAIKKFRDAFYKSCFEMLSN